MARAVFLDRDGVINRKPPEGLYVIGWDQVELLPGVAHAIQRLRDANFLAVLVTNQRAIAKGLLSESALASLHQRMWRELFHEDKGLDAVYYCPHDKEPPCHCRKPRPGMLRRAAFDHEIDLTSSWMVGDSETDVQAGKAASCRTIRISSEFDCLTSANAVAESLDEAVGVILSAEKSFDIPRNTHPGHLSRFLESD